MDGWIPDDGLVEKVRLVGYSIKDLPEDSKDIDRIWIVVALSALGWTAQEIADRMDCSLRLIRNIKAEQPAYALAAYAFELRHQILAIAGTCRIEVTSLRQQVYERDTAIDRMKHQNTALVLQLQNERKRSAMLMQNQLSSLSAQLEQQIAQLRRQRADLINQLQLERQSNSTPRGKQFNEKVHPLRQSVVQRNIQSGWQGTDQAPAV